MFTQIQNSGLTPYEWFFDKIDGNKFNELGSCGEINSSSMKEELLRLVADIKAEAQYRFDGIRYYYAYSMNKATLEVVETADENAVVGNCYYPDMDQFFIILKTGDSESNKTNTIHITDFTTQENVQSKMGEFTITKVKKNHPFALRLDSYTTVLRLTNASLSETKRKSLQLELLAVESSS